MGYGDVYHMRLDPRLPLFLVYVEKSGEPGDEDKWLSQGSNRERMKCQPYSVVKVIIQRTEILKKWQLTYAYSLLYLCLNFSV